MWGRARGGGADPAAPVVPLLTSRAAGETPLTCASYCGHYAAVKALLEEGDADVNLTRQDGTTPLNLAAYADAKTALLLLDHGARPDTNTSKSSPFPVPLVMSAARGDVELCTRLIQVCGGSGGLC